MQVPTGSLRDTLKPRAREREAAAGYESYGGDLRLPVRPNKSEPDIVQFRADEPTAAVVESPCNEDFAVGQQGRSVHRTCGVEAARGSPGPARRVVQFRTGGR